MALTEQQKKFVEEYVRDLNATRAYKAAFRVENFNLLADPEVTIIDAYATLRSEAHAIRKYAALLVLKVLIRPQFLSFLLAETVYPFSRKDPRVREWTKIVKLPGKCKVCGAKNQLEAHHIIRWADFPSGRVDPTNGVCLCTVCHAREHRGEKEENLILSKLREGVVLWEGN